MKLRIQGNSIRLRLSRSEVERFAASGRITEALEFGASGDFTYALEASESRHQIAATHSPNGIRILVPHPLARDWTGTDQVSIYAVQPLSDGRELQILIEKDFQCIHKGQEGNADAYPNPRESETTEHST